MILSAVARRGSPPEPEPEPESEEGKELQGDCAGPLYDHASGVCSLVLLATLRLKNLFLGTGRPGPEHQRTNEFWSPRRT